MMNGEAVDSTMDASKTGSRPRGEDKRESNGGREQMKTEFIALHCTAG